MTFRVTLPLLLLSLLLLLLLLIPPALGQADADDDDDSDLVQPYNVSDFSAYWKDKIYSINTTSPIATALQDNETARAIIAPSFQILDELYDVFSSRRDNKHVDACNLPNGHRWASNSQNRPRVFQIGELVRDCYAYLDVNVAVQNGEFSGDLFHSYERHILEGRHASFHALATASVPDDGNWTDPNAPYENVSKEFLSLGQTCSLDAISAYRLQGEWYLRVAMTNHPVQAHMQLGQRHVVNEWLHTSMNRSLRTVQRRYGEGRDALEWSTTVLYADQGVIGTTWGAPTQFDDFYGPLAQAYRQADIATDQGRDSITPSNIAVLALPMVMNLIPVAFVADLNTCAMVMYIIFTDIVSAVPFLIKGVELIRLSMPSKPVATAFYGGNETFGQIESWVAVCRGHSHFGVNGIVFVSVACFAILGGVCLELWAIHIIRRRKASGLGRYGPFGAAMIDETHAGALGATDYDGADNDATLYENAPTKADEKRTAKASLLGSYTRHRRSGSAAVQEVVGCEEGG